MPNEHLAVHAPTVVAHPHADHQWQRGRPRWRRRLGRRRHQAPKQHDDLLVVQLLRPVERSLAVRVFHKWIGALGEQSLHHARFVVPSSIVERRALWLLWLLSSGGGSGGRGGGGSAGPRPLCLARLPIVVVRLALGILHLAPPSWQCIGGSSHGRRSGHGGRGLGRRHFVN